ncbi:hypothetical protein HYN59_07975 [Flavobacterium album]|uniref:DUF2306 domain-containing protein n=2 Tax=Flavobacterium album TaxID=2175091 RepID=A0A2S1R2W0_9FLAO|nr:hypothetical protein HYN59_07975 [Flavobacterium album]
MVKITCYYIPISPNAAFLQIKQTEVQTRPEYIYLFYAHVYSSIFVLLAGFVQFFRFKGSLGRKIHRIAGYQYVVLLLILAAPSGIYMGWYANGGITSRISFMLLGLLWWITTFIAMHKIRTKQYTAHRSWMIRSFALSLSAVTLRLWKVTLVCLFHPAPMDVYQIVAWLGWVPNIIIAEIIIRNQQNTNQ